MRKTKKSTTKDAQKRRTIEIKRGKKDQREQSGKIKELRIKEERSKKKSKGRGKIKEQREHRAKQKSQMTNTYRQVIRSRAKQQPLNILCSSFPFSSSSSSLISASQTALGKDLLVVRDSEDKASEWYRPGSGATLALGAGSKGLRCDE